MVPVALVIAVARPRYALLVVFLIGSGVRSTHDVRPPNILDDGFPIRVTAVLEGAPESRVPGTYLNVRLITVGEEPWSGRARLSYFPSDGDPALAALFSQLDLGSGDRIEVLVRLRRPGIYRNPGGFDYRRFLERRGIYWTGSIRSPRLIQVLDRGWHGPDRIRRWATRRIADRLRGGETTVALALGMVLGQRRRLPAAAERKFQAAGLIHLLVVSGFNLAIVAAVAVWLGRRLPFGRRQRVSGSLFAIVLILSYAFLVEGETPVVRATLMAVLFIVATLLDRGYAVGNALCAAGILVLFLDPVALEDSGFQLTFAAVLAILLLAVPLIRWGPGTLFAAMRHLDNPTLDTRFGVKINDWRVRQRLRTELTGRPLWLVTLPRMAVLLLAETAIVTLSVQFALLPWSIESYHRLSPIALPLNILGAVVATIVTPLGLVLILVPDPIAMPIAWIVEGCLAALVAAVDLALELPGATFRVPSPPITLWIVFGSFLIAMAYVARRRWRGGLICGAAFGLGLLMIIAVGNFEPRPPALPTLTFLDVGQGDALLVELPDGQKIMVDGGGVATGAYRSLNDEGSFSIGEDVLTPYLFSRGIRRLDALVLTHAHYDHIDGLFDLLENFSVGELWLGPNPMVPRFQALLEDASRAGIPTPVARAGRSGWPLSGSEPTIHPTCR